MKFPKRVRSHVIESESFKILMESAPESWIIREVSERDYGIDCYVEMTMADEVVGDLFSVQLKGVEDLEWPKDEEAGARSITYSGIKISTINYWIGLPMPVFLFVADLKSSKLYFASVHRQIRERYNEYSLQKTFGFKLYEFMELKHQIGQHQIGQHQIGQHQIGQTLHAILYVQEKFFLQHKRDITTLLTHLKTYIDFIDTYSVRDYHSGLEDHEELLFNQLFETCRSLSGYLNIKWELDELTEVYDKDAEFTRNPDAHMDDYYRLHQWSLNRILSDLRNVLLDIMSKVKTIVTKEQSAYWEKRHPLIYQCCDALDLERLRANQRTPSSPTPCLA